MKTLIKVILVLILIGAGMSYISTNSGYASKRTGCEVHIYIANNSRFDCQIQIDGIQQVGKMFPSNIRLYTAELAYDKPKKLNVKVIYEDPDYIEPKSYILITHKLECGQTDSVYIAHTK